MWISKKKAIRLREENRKAVNQSLLEKLDDASGEALEEVLLSHGIHTAAIYGAGAVGQKLAGKLQGINGTRVEYFIDKFAEEKSMQGIPVLRTCRDFLPEVQGVLITPCHEKAFVIFEIGSYFTEQCKLIGLDEILQEVGKWQ
jgi:hypothetical protein